MNTTWTREELNEKLPAGMKQYLQRQNIDFYTINAVKIAQKLGMGSHFNMIMQAAFFKLTHLIPLGQAIRIPERLCDLILWPQGRHVVQTNNAAIDHGTTAMVKVQARRTHGIWRLKVTPM